MNAENFGKNMTRLAVARLGSLGALGPASGVATSLLYSYRDGVRYPGLEKAVAIANALGVGMDELLLAPHPTESTSAAAPPVEIAGDGGRDGGSGDGGSA